MCVAFDDPCERRVVQVSYNDQMKKYVLQALPESKENDSLVKGNDRRQNQFVDPTYLTDSK